MLESQGRKKHMVQPGLEPRTSRIPCEHSDHWATEPHAWPVTISPCLIRFVPESSRNQQDSPFAAHSLSMDPYWPPNVTEQEKEHGPTGTGTQDLSHTVTLGFIFEYVNLYPWCQILAQFDVNQIWLTTWLFVYVFRENICCLILSEEPTDPLGEFVPFCLTCFVWKAAFKFHTHWVYFKRR